MSRSSAASPPATARYAHAPSNQPLRPCAEYGPSSRDIDAVPSRQMSGLLISGFEVQAPWGRTVTSSHFRVSMFTFGTDIFVARASVRGFRAGIDLGMLVLAW